jgi:hypothetical protein
MFQTMAGVTIIWLLVDSNKNTLVKAYTMDIAFSLVVPLRVLHRPGGKLLFYYLRGCTPKPMLYQHTILLCTDVKIPANVIGEIGLLLQLTL